MPLLPPNKIDSFIGKRIRKRRRELNLTQSDLGKILGMSYQQVQKYETGKNRIGAAQLWELAKVLGVAIDYFFRQRT